MPGRPAPAPLQGLIYTTVVRSRRVLHPWNEHTCLQAQNNASGGLSPAACLLHAKLGSLFIFKAIGVLLS